MRLQLLGHFQIEDHRGRSYLPRTRKTRAILAVLALANPKPVLRLHLAALLWSRREKEQARASLRQSVHELQDSLGPAWHHAFMTDRHSLALRAPELVIDAHRLSQPTPASVALLDGLQDQLLTDLNGLDPAFDRWLEEERARFARIARTIGENLLAQCGDPVAAIDVAERLLAIDRKHEGAWRVLIRSHAERGDAAAALESYDRLRGALATSPDGRPSRETEELVERIRARSAAPRPVEMLPSAPAVADRSGTATRDRSTLRLRVLPLRRIGEGVDEGVAIGLAEEISAGLSRFRWISCMPASIWPDHPRLSPAPTPHDRGPRDRAGGDGATALGDTDLLLEGTIQRAGPRFRIIMRLVDLRVGGEIVWAGRFDSDAADTLALQDELGATIVAQIDPELMRYEGRRAAAARPLEPTARDLLLQALPAIFQLERDSFLSARGLLEASLAADPASSVAHGWLAYWYLLYVGQGWAADPDAATARAARLAERAVTLDPADARALTLAGHVRGFLAHRPREARELHERALKLNPNLALAWCFSGLANAYVGEHEDALRHIREAIRLSPSDPHGFFFDMALIMPLLLMGNYAAAANAGRRAVEVNPLFSSTYKGYLCALGWLGLDVEAAEARERLLALEPGFSVARATRRSPLCRPEDRARYAEGLRRGGLAEGDESADAAISAIDLAPREQHSPAGTRESTLSAWRTRHEEGC